MNKLPMTVWLDRHAAGVQTLGFYSPNKECLHVEGNMTTFGPYVHLEQFMEEVERRAKQICNDSRKGNWVCDSMINHHLYVSDAMQELAKEIMEGKA